MSFEPATRAQTEATPEADNSMADTAEETAKILLDQAMKDVREKRRAQRQSLHGWKREAAILAVMRALNGTA
jgi:hypothetical protein